MSMNLKINNFYKTTDYKVNSKAKTEKSSSVSSTKTDGFSISSTAQDFQTALKVAKNTPDIRQEKVDELKGQIQSGNYSVDTSGIADKILGTI
ncbi:MAG: flagellar biosynthesis anti-sigma factor FlgM [Lachnospirales bacterium]